MHFELVNSAINADTNLEKKIILQPTSFALVDGNGVDFLFDQGQSYLSSASCHLTVIYPRGSNFAEDKQNVFCLPFGHSFLSKLF